jgi:perosamine synthetase
MPSNLSASLGFAQLQRIDELIMKKRKIFAIYQATLHQIPGIRLNYSDHNVNNSYWCTVVNFDQTEYKPALDINRYLQSKGIPTRPFFHPLSTLPAFEKLGLSTPPGTNPISRNLFESTVCLPSALNITEENQNHILSVLKDGLGEIKINA